MAILQVLIGSLNFKTYIGSSLFENQMLSRFRTVSEGGILAINEAGVSTFTQKETKFGLSVSTGKEKTFSY